MTKAKIKSPDILPSAYFILHRSDEGYSEIGVDSANQLFIRYTLNGHIQSVIPLGKHTAEKVTQLSERLEDLSFLLPS